MVEELQAIERNNTWELVEFPAHTKAIKVGDGVYVQVEAQNITIIYLYVDDLLVTGNSMENLSKFKELMKREFEMSDLGNLSYFLGMEFQISKQGMVLYQRKHVKEILKTFRMDESNLASSSIKTNLKLEKHGKEDRVDETLFKQIVGSLRYVYNSRPDIGFSVGLVSRYMSEPKVSHMKAARRILRYMKGSINCGIWFPRDSESKEVVVNCYSDAD
ncbi:uncharacterized mitochondrial protein AtMg00810-like [Lathyrus oleraceus]|uniref:uncharacterized mitochondrial protein AtMg00810-like n=1 Tax=Pisum sativum TaxID=3888 RepID=UPI0021D10EB5|nr:uncharacterized mitochondrial protein AtMg00810-like [Pisum sativum]